MNNKQNKIIRLTLSYIVILAMIFIVVYPLLWVIGSSLNPGQSLSGSKMFPENPTLVHYQFLFDLEKSNYLFWYWNSMKISITTMILSVISVAFTAYAFSRYRFIGRKNGLMTFLILQMIPKFHF